MGLESATYLDDLVSTNPTGSDDRSAGDDHIRMVKAVLKATLPGLAGKAWRVQTKSGTYPATATDNMSVIFFTSTATLNLPAAATAGNGYMLLLVSSSGVTVTVDPNSTELIDGASTISVPWGYAFLFCTGSTWISVRVQPPAGTILTDPSLTRPVANSIREGYSSPGSVSGAVSADISAYNNFVYTLAGNITLTLASPPSSSYTGAVTFFLIQDGTGGRTVTWPGTVKWPSGVAPVLTTTAGKIDVVTLVTWDGGTSWLGFVGGQNY